MQVFVSGANIETAKWFEAYKTKAEQYGFVGEENIDYKKDLNRLEAAKIILKLFDYQGNNFEANITKNPFIDTSNDAAVKMYQLGIITGYEDKTFRPENTISKESFILLLGKVAESFEIPIRSTEVLFDDDQDISEKARPYIYFFREQGIISGVKNTLNPKANVTYQEAIVIITNFFEKMIPKTIFIDSTNYVVMYESVDSIKDRFSLADDPFNISTDYFVYKVKNINNVLIGIKQDRVVSVFTNSQNFNMMGYDTDFDAQLLHKFFTKEQDDNFVYRQEDYHSNIYIYSDLYDDGNTIDSIYLVDKSIDQNIASNKFFLNELAKLGNSITNLYRAKQNLHEIVWDSEISALSYAHSEDMKFNNHVSYENAKGENTLTRFKNSNIKLRSVSENLYKGQGNIYDVVYTWVNNPGNRSSLLSNDYTKGGLAVSFKSPNFFIVQDLVE